MVLQMNKQKNIDYFAQNLSPDTVHSVMDGASSGTEKRFNILNKDFENADELRVLAGKIKSHTISNLDIYLDQAVKSMNKNGVQTHFAVNAQNARSIILDLLKNNNIDRLVKSKSMATEEIHLNEYLEENGIGYKTNAGIVPIVPSAIIFDLGITGNHGRPGPDAGYSACTVANDSHPEEGSVGAGTGATVGKIMGMSLATKGGVGSYSIKLGQTVVLSLIHI